MMISVGLVMLIMLMFAEIFQMATQSIGTQRGIAENDQRARTLSTTLRADLDKRTMRLAMPFHPVEGDGAGGTLTYPNGWTITDATLQERLLKDREGYLYISENNQSDGSGNPIPDQTQDVLQFTTWVKLIRKSTDTTPYYGRAVLLTGDLNGNLNIWDEFINSPDRPTALNQPVADDGQLNPFDETGASGRAEIAYFLRNGNLYRRQLLIREPLEVAGARAQPTYKYYDTITDALVTANPFNTQTVPGVDPQPYPYATFPLTGGDTGDFWNDFDYSAHSVYTPADPTANTGAVFHGYDYLLNGMGQPIVASLIYSYGVRASLGIPYFRFGHDHISGQPREFVSNGFIGRFTQEETSHIHFNYPQAACRDETSGTIIGNGIPTSAGTALALNANDRVVDLFRAGTRRGEDLVLPNVHSFDVKVWDERLQQFVDVGHTGTVPLPYDTGTVVPGDFHQFRRLNPAYGSSVPANNRVFDSWHHGIDLAEDGEADPPPFRPMFLYPDPSLGGPAAGPHAQEWAPGSSYDAAEPDDRLRHVFATAASPRFSGYIYVYECITSGTSDAVNEPPWPTRVGMEVDDGTVRWRCIRNARAILALQITIQYYDISSEQMRQMTIVQSMTE